MINWKLRFQNKAVLCALLAQTAAIAYTVLGFFGVVPTVTESALVAFGHMVVELLVLMGVVTDPTTRGLGDSQQAMDYEKPRQ